MAPKIVQGTVAGVMQIQHKTTGRVIEKLIVYSHTTLNAQDLAWELASLKVQFCLQPEPEALYPSLFEFPKVKAESNAECNPTLLYSGYTVEVTFLH